MDTREELKNKIIENLAILDSQLTEEEIKKASKEDLLKYLELTEKINARLKML